MKHLKLISTVAFVLVFTMLFSMFGVAVTVPGDYDSSEKVTAKDAIYLLYNTVFGDEDYPLYYDGDLNKDGRIDSDDAVYMLYNSIFGTEEYPIPEIDETGRIPIYFNKNGQVNSYELLPGDTLPEGDDIVTADFVRYKFLGWFDSSLTTEYKAVPDHVVTMYAKYDGYTAYSFDFGGIYDPNNRNMIEAIKDPFGGNGKVLHTTVINNTSAEYNGTYRGLSPSAYDSNSNSGFKVEKGHRYQVSFDYRYNEDAPSSAACTVSAFAVSSQGVHMDLNSSNRKQLSPSFSSTGGSTLSNKGKWAECTFAVTVNADFEYFYFRFLGASRTDAYDFYIDNLVITDITVDNSVKLVKNGVVESTDLAVGKALPTLESVYDMLSDRSFEFDGWYDASLTTKYTTVVEGVTTYYAKFKNYSYYSFESAGIFDPNGRYSATSKGAAPWWRELDPTGDDNICLRVDLSNNANNTNVCLQQIEGATDGYKLTAGNKYIISYRYYVDTIETSGFPSFQMRGSTAAGIGTSGGKTDSLNGGDFETFGKWVDMAYVFTAPSTVETSPYLILMSQRTNTKYTKVYLDDVYICEFDATDDIKISTPAYDITTNDHGDVSTIHRTQVGANVPDPKNYYGATFKGWYDENGTVPYPTISESYLELYAKHDGDILNFENGGYYDPNGNFGKTAISPHSIVIDPTNSKNTVLKTTLNNNGNNTNFALNASGYSNEGYKLTVGNTYEISFMYYIENLTKGAVGLQFRGCKEANIGIAGGKSGAYGIKSLSEVNAWTGVTVKFTYNGEGLTDEASPYLIMMLQYTTASVNVYIDDIVIKETEPAKTYVKKSVKMGGWTLGYQPRPHNIVIPTYNFSYIARMQCEELEKFIENTVTTGCDVKIVTEENWKEADNQFNIFVGDVKGHSRDNAKYKIDASNFTSDDFAYNFGTSSIYINGGSTYALAMGISEVIKELEAAKDGTDIGGKKVKGKYSEKIDSYSTATYYRPTFLEDFEGDEIDTTRWNIVNGSAIAARDFVDEKGVLQKDQGWTSIRSPEHTYVEDGKLVIAGAYSKENKTFYGGMLRSHGKLEYRFGYYEVSCITPHGAGIWTANWLTPHGYTDGLYLSEVDVNESFGNAKASNFNMHSWPRAAASNLGMPKYSLDNISGCSAKNSTLNKGLGYADGFHTFGYMWDENSAKFIVDGRVQFEYRYDDKHTAKPSDGNVSYPVVRTNDYDAFREKLSIIVSMTVANPASGSEPILGADYWNTTNKYIVDYVHIYQIDGQEIYFYGDETAE